MRLKKTISANAATSTESANVAVSTEKEIRKLLDRFMAGETSLEEEAKIGEWFGQHSHVPEDLKDYQEMFAYFDAGMPLDETTHENGRRNSHGWHRQLFVALAVAASLALVLILVVPHLKNDNKSELTSYVQQDKRSKHQVERIADTQQELEPEPKIEVRSDTGAVKQRVIKIKRKKSYHKHQFAPAPPANLLAESIIERIPVEAELQTEAQLLEQQEQQEDILNRLFFYNVEKETSIDTYLGRLSSMTMDEDEESEDWDDEE